MTLAHDRCYRACQSRDRRFDGRFFIGVTTTGVYCRPICPARTPRPENVRFFACAAAAVEAGFRACRRCRPESAPGTPAWVGSPAVVARALRLLQDGALDRMGVDGLAERMGLGARQLRRLFDTHLGASPVAIAETRRAHFVKRMLEETPLPVYRIAFAAGFGSVRRMNHVFRRSFGLAPTDLRRRLVAELPGTPRGSRPPTARAARKVLSARRATDDAGPRVIGEQPIELKLSFRPPFDLDLLLGFLAPRALPGVEVVDARGYRRTMQSADGATGVVAIERVPGARGEAALRLRVSPVLAESLLDLVGRARRLFDLDAAPAVIAQCLRRDPLLAGSVKERPGLRVPGAWSPFESAVRTVLGQQVTVRGATTLAGRLVREFGERASVEGHAGAQGPDDGGRSGSGSGSGSGLTHLFPRPEALARAPLERIGIPGKRAEALRGLAAAVADGRPVLEALPTLEETAARLAELPGLGPWTAHVIALRALGEPDAFPAGDLGIRKVVAGFEGRSLSEAEVVARAEAWRPWRAYATLHLWEMLTTMDADARAHRERRTA